MTGKTYFPDVENKLPDPCTSCTGTCCRSVSVQWEPPDTEADWDNLKWLVAHKNVNVYKDFDGDWLVEFLTDCDYLDSNNRCKIYEKRMEICQTHPTEDCERYAEGDYAEVIFRNLADVDNYLVEQEARKKAGLACPPTLAASPSSAG
ncbi:MAG: YkgJ family cysteine cluster protein [Fibrobacterota bacterium]